MNTKKSPRSQIKFQKKAVASFENFIDDVKNDKHQEVLKEKFSKTSLVKKKVVKRKKTVKIKTPTPVFEKEND